MSNVLADWKTNNTTFTPSEELLEVEDNLRREISELTERLGNEETEPSETYYELASERESLIKPFRDSEGQVLVHEMSEAMRIEIKRLDRLMASEKYSGDGGKDKVKMSTGLTQQELLQLKKTKKKEKILLLLIN